MLSPNTGGSTAQFKQDNLVRQGIVEDDSLPYLAVETGTAKAGRWVGERRNVAADFKRAFEGIPGRVTTLAIASDTDDTGESAHAGFADFHFTSARETCAG